MKRLSGKDGPEFQTVQQQRGTRGAGLKPIGKQPDILTPILECHLVETAGTLSDAAVVIAKDFNVMVRQKACPANPRQITVMPLRCERTDKQSPSDRFCHLMQDGVEVCSSHLEVTCLLHMASGRGKLVLQCRS